MSQAPGLRGTPDSGHCSSATTRASCARSSARPTSRTIRARPAMSLADSILQTASIALWTGWVSVAVTATDQTIFIPPLQDRDEPRLLLVGDLRPQALLLLPQLGSEFGSEVLGLEHRAKLDLGLPFHGIGAALDPFDRLFHGLHLPEPEAGDQLLGLGEGPVDHRPLVGGEPHTLALRARVEPLTREHHAGFHQLFVEFPHLGEELLAGHDTVLGIL